MYAHSGIHISVSVCVCVCVCVNAVSACSCENVSRHISDTKFDPDQ